MQVRDFGVMNGPVVLFGGPYSNLAALEALAPIIGEGDAICTGDVIGYCAEPVETVNLIRALNIPVIAGNCEKQIASGAEDCGCGFDAGSACDLLSKGWYPYARAACDTETRGWLGDLPDIGLFTHLGRRFAVIHGGVRDISRFIWAVSPDEVFLEEITAIEGRVGPIGGVVSGHSGLPFQRQIDGYDWINAGVIGMPPHDGTPETCFAVMRDGSVQFERLAYDHTRTRAVMEEAGLVQGYEVALSSGIWPSEDVLPQELRR